MGRLVVVVIGELGMAALTQRLAHPHWSALRQDPSAVWQASAGDLVVTVLHLAAWLSAWWLLVGTGHDLVAVAVDLRRGRVGRRSRLAPAWVQRVLHRAVGTVLLMGVMAGPASAATGAAAAQPTDVVQVVAPPVPIIGLPGATPGQQPGDAATTSPPSSPQPDAATDGSASATDDPADGADGSTGSTQGPSDSTVSPDNAGQPTSGADADAASGASVDAADGPAEDVHVVAAGENLWVIARQQLSARGQAAPTDREVHAHWLQLIQRNIDLLRSGDPDRIFPGERLRLPGEAASTTSPDDGGGVP